MWFVRLLVWGLATAALCGVTWWGLHGDHPRGTIAVALAAFVCAGGAGARSKLAGLFVALICLGVTLTVAGAAVLTNPFTATGAPAVLIGLIVVFMTIRGWMRAEGYI